MQQLLDFLCQLTQHNEKPWFDAHKATYKQVQLTVASLTDQLIAGISQFDDSVKGLTVKDCTYRIYRDLRFSPDKTPYKTHIGIYVCPHGKGTLYAGYYFHMEPTENQFLGHSLLCSGLYCPTPNVLKSVREDIMLNGHEYEDAVQEAAGAGFELEQENSLKRVPLGFSADSPYASYFKLRNHLVSRPIDNDFLLDPHLIPNTLAAFEKTASYNKLLNRSVEYALHGLY